MIEDRYRAIRSEMSERQIKLLGSYVRPQLYVRPNDVEAADVDALVSWGLIEPTEGRLHTESFTGGRTVSETAGDFEPTDEGRAWFEWYEGQR